MSDLPDFEGIRPYRDDEVDAVLKSLLNDQEFLAFLAKFRLHFAYRFLPRLTRQVVRLALRWQLRKIHDIKGFQLAIAATAKKLVEETMTSFHCEGLELLDPQQAYLYISNHRDIAGDSMLVDYALYCLGRETVRIAVGDNLVQRQFATDLMKLNKSFFIRRSEVGAKKIYAALLQSSQYLHESIATNNSVWIAQSEGRAKDAIDWTDPAVIKMLALAERKKALSEVIRELHIVPVAIAYEFDPCDVLKARALHCIATQGDYQKSPGEDLLSLVKGLAEFKGRVTLRFGRALDGDFEIPEQVAAEIDRQVLDGLQLYPINYWALERLSKMAEGELTDAGLTEYLTVWRQVGHLFNLKELKDPAALEHRLAQCPDEYRREWLQMYANPVVNKVRHGAANLAPA